MAIEHVTILGAGNLGSQLGRAMADEGFRIDQVFSRTIEKARPLAQALEAGYTTLLPEIRSGADLYILAVRDDAIETVARALARHLPASSLVAHTSGARESHLLAPYFDRYGVFYPLQTLSVGRQVPMNEVPFCICANKGEDETLLLQAANRLSASVHRIGDADRAYLHLAAVFSNNFPNHLYDIAYRLLEYRGLDFNLLRPLITETAAKVMYGKPAELQTGPAIRADKSTLDIHLKLLDDYPAIRELYLQLTRSISPNLKI